MKLCRDCKHFTKDAPQCHHRGNIKTDKPDYVAGGARLVIYYWQTAQYCREAEKSCSQDADWFAPAVTWHDDKPDERAGMHATTQPGDLDCAGRPLKPGS